LKIILASSSSYRKSLLKRLISNFESRQPDIDENPIPEETPDALAKRLACEKARAVAQHFQNEPALVIGSDQVAWANGKQLHKPGDRAKNIAQLLSLSEQTAHFYTGLCVINTQTNKTQTSVELYTTEFRSLTTKQVQHYVDKEPALDCAGGFKMEGLGISLFKRVYGDDPNTLIGLPLIRLVEFLENEGIALP